MHSDDLARLREQSRLVISFGFSEKSPHQNWALSPKEALLC